MTKLEFDDEPPAMDGITPYDELHLVTYLRLLDAEAEGADWQEVAGIVFDFDPAIDAARAKAVYDSHLTRAQWIRDSGFRELLGRS